MQKRYIRILFFILLVTGLHSVLAIDEVTPIPGQIAVVGNDYNIYTYNATAETLTQLTDDASELRHYQWVSWSSDGRLAYFCCETSPEGQAFILRDGESTSQLAYENSGAFIIFAYWSPADCGDNCRELALLLNEPEGLSLDILTDDDEREVITVGRGSPFYFHWGSDGTQMIFHRQNRNLDIHNRAQNDISESLPDSSGLFQTPVWSPVDNRILVALPSATEETSDLVIIENGEINTLVENIPGFLGYLWSPDGRYIAYRTIDGLDYSGMTVIDANTGAIVMESGTQAVPSFFWSPDSHKIAYLTFGTDTGIDSAGRSVRASHNLIQDESGTQLTWHILDIESQTNLSYSSFEPTFEMLYLLTYFDQFAPGHHLWSPDSEFLVFAGKREVNQPVSQVYILDTEDHNAEPRAITGGVYGIWSFE